MAPIWAKSAYISVRIVTILHDAAIEEVFTWTRK